MGSAVALDPRNGEVLALVSAPAFNPNLFARRLEHGDWRAILDAPHHPFTTAPSRTPTLRARCSRSSRDRRLTEHVVNDAVSCPGATSMYSHPSAAGGRRPRLGRLEARDRALLRRLLLPFGRGAHHRAHRPLATASSASHRHRSGRREAGAHPGRDWSMRARHMWFPGETISVSIGQGPLLVTPLQMAVMIAIVANGGHGHPAPDQGSQPPRARSRVSARRTTSSRWCAPRWSTKAARRARSPGHIRVAGKTGTAQVLTGDARRSRSSSTSAAITPGSPRSLRSTILAWWSSSSPSTAATARAAAPIAKALYESISRRLPSLAIPEEGPPLRRCRRSTGACCRRCCSR